MANVTSYKSVENSSRLPICPDLFEPFTEQPSTHGLQTGLKNKVKLKSTVIKDCDNAYSVVQIVTMLIMSKEFINTISIYLNACLM